MKWLELSSEKFEPIPDIQFSLKKPLFAASVVLSYSRGGVHSSEGPLRARAELRARIPLKGELHYSVEVVGRDGGAFGGAGAGLFAFAKIWERDVSRGHGRTFESHESSYSLIHVGDGVAPDETVIDVINESPSRLLAHVQTLPAFRQTHTVDESTYGGYIALGKRIEALRFDRVGPAADALARTKYQYFEETYEVRSLRVPRMLNEEEWAALPWKTRTPIEISYDVEKKTLTAARFHVPIIGKIEIKA